MQKTFRVGKAHQEPPPHHFLRFFPEFLKASDLNYYTLHFSPTFSRLCPGIPSRAVPVPKLDKSRPFGPAECQIR